MLVEEPILDLVTIYVSIGYAVLYACKHAFRHCCVRSMIHYKFVKYSRRFPSSSSIITDLQFAKTGFSFLVWALGHQSGPYPIICPK